MWQNKFGGQNVADKMWQKKEADKMRQTAKKWQTKCGRQKVANKMWQTKFGVQNGADIKW